MFPGEIVASLPEQLHIYSRSNIGTGSLPAGGATITVPIFAPGARGRHSVLSPGPATEVVHGLATATHGLRRYAGLWVVDVFLFQNVAATLELRERTVDALTQVIPGVANTTRSVWLRQVRANVPFRATWRLGNMEARIEYVNGASAVTTFDFNVIVRAL